MVKADYWARPNFRMWDFTRRSMFRNMEDVLREMEDLMEQEFTNLSQNVNRNYIRERKLPSGAVVKDMGPFVYGYSMTVGPDGKPKIREFGNIKPKTHLGRPHLDIKDRREPLADVLSSDGEVQVIVELPGVSKDDINLRGTENSLTVSVDTSERKYYKKLDLSIKVDPKSAKSKYTNGVLEVTLKKLDKEAPEGKPIKVD
ncbi:MAG: Hsp20/alpha crystallin family protein [Candidatus Bathyarchaeota archaeon]